jgi:hypothetical protein
MKIEFDKKKSAEAISTLVQNTVDLGKKAATEARVGMTAMVEKSKADEYARRLKKYNPLFPEQYQSASFNLPNIIVIVDDAVRRGIDVCEGSIGWLSKDTGSEVLHLYDEAVAFSGIQFVPAATCDAVYYVDSFDRNRFIRTDCIFSKAHEEKIAELKHIAYCIGAKRCTIDISESSTNFKAKQTKADLNASAANIKAKASAEGEVTNKHSKRRHGHDEIEFTGFRLPKRPTLKWFEHDDGINRLIDMCCNGRRGVKSETLEISGTTSATMTQSVACAIDSVINKTISAKGRTSMKAQAKEEHRSKLLLHIEF